jgi:ketosteroid isomerase-like protein
MGQAREVADQLTAAVMNRDLDRAAALHADDAVSVTPDAGELAGREASVAYLRGLWEMFPDAAYESLYAYEAGDAAIDEGIVTATHTEPLPMEGQEPLPPTGRSVRFRMADVTVVRDGLVVSHRFYFDQLDILRQLGVV